MPPIDPATAAAHRSATVSNPADPEVIAGRPVRGDAWFSPCRTWRWRLTRTWEGGDGGTCLWLMLNPSTADAVRVDNTVRRSVAFSIGWGFSTCLVGNVFALRATSPEHLYRHPDPVGADNDAHLAAMAGAAGRIVLGWGNHGAVGGRFRAVARLLLPWAERCVHLGATASGMPRHPLYVAGATAPVPAGELVRRLAGG